MNKIDANHVNFFYGDFQALKDKIGRASCRERVCLYV